MTAKKTKTTKTKPKKKYPTTVTIREFEEAKEPCAAGYMSALLEMKCAPVKDGQYWLLWKENGYDKKVRKSKYGPDDPIPLGEVLPDYRDWVLSMDKFSGLRDAIDAETDAIREEAEELRSRAEELEYDVSETAMNRVLKKRR